MRVSGAIKQIQHVASLGLGGHVAIPEMLALLDGVIPGSFNSFFWLDDHNMVADAYAPYVILNAFQFFSKSYPTLPGDEPTFDKIIGIGRVVGGAQALHSSHDYKNSILVNEVWRPYNIGCGLDVVLRRNDRVAALLFVNRDALHSRFSAAEYRMLSALAPHFEHALTGSGNLDPIDETEERTGMLVVAADGIVLSACENALPLVVRACALDDPSHRGLPMDLRRLPLPLIELLGRHRRIARGEWSLPPRLERRTRWGVFRARVFPQRSAGSEGPPESFVVTLSQHLPSDLRLTRRLAAFDLSPRERQVAFHIGRGSDADNGAAALGVSIATWRSYVKRVYERMDISSRGEFHALVQQTAPVSVSAR